MHRFARWRSQHQATAGWLASTRETVTAVATGASALAQAIPYVNPARNLAVSPRFQIIFLTAVPADPASLQPLQALSLAVSSLS